jgi:hypothetical protein
MTQEEFIAGIRRAVYESAIKGTLSIIQKPPGRRPSDHLVNLSNWVAGLSDTNKIHLEAIVELAARQAVFGMLAVLDGVRRVEGEEMDGSFELWFKKGEEEILLNAPNGEYLHDLFNQQISQP